MANKNTKFTSFLSSALREVGLYCLILAFIASTFYAITGYFSNPIFNIALIILDIFILYHILDILDRKLHFGSHREQNNNSENPSDADSEESISPDDEIISDNSHDFS